MFISKKENAEKKFSDFFITAFSTPDHRVLDAWLQKEIHTKTTFSNIQIQHEKEILMKNINEMNDLKRFQSQNSKRKKPKKNDLKKQN